jgi:hypothetical protein
MSNRRTIVAHGRLAMREVRVHAARGQAHGLLTLTFEQLAARLAGGFSRPVEHEALITAIRDSLPATPLGELNSIKQLPGMLHASAETLRKAWRAGIDLSARASQHSRIASLAALERAVLERLPVGMMRPSDLVAAAMERIEHACAIFGTIEIVGITELSPCWRPLLRALAERIPVRWKAGPRDVPAWLDGSTVEILREAPASPVISVVSASTTLHEAIEAVRWARELLTSGRSEPHDIAIAAANPADYDDHLLALRADANLEVHFVHGVSAMATRDGQAAAALGDVLVRGLSQNRVRRLAALANSLRGLFKGLPEGWTRILPQDAPLAALEAWRRMLASLEAGSWPDGVNHATELLQVLELLARGLDVAEEAGELLLNGRARTIWVKALTDGPRAAVDTTLASLRLDDSLDACVSIAWMPASALAASPRPFVRLMGLTSRGWPRQVSEDRLLSDHIIPSAELDPLPIAAADRRDFETILRTTAKQVVLSRARRDAEGRLLGKSPLLHGRGEEIYLRRTRIPAHAMSETDRLLARPNEFATTVQAQSAVTCWRNWALENVTGHDGLTRQNHPVILAILERVQSASSLRRLLRDPLGFVWRYGFGFRAPNVEEEPLVLEPPQFGELVHSLLERAVRLIEARGGLSGASSGSIERALKDILPEVAGAWESGQSIPPRVIWERTLAEAKSLAVIALTEPENALDGQRSFSEVPFGGQIARDASSSFPWDPVTPVSISGTELRIGGFIDRIDLAADGRSARVRDYKTGRTPKQEIVIDGGRELQRCLYAYAVKALLGEHVAVEASLNYPRDGTVLHLDRPEVVLETVRNHLTNARLSLIAGRMAPGPDTGNDYNDLAFALPANASKAYCRRKEPAVGKLLGPAASVWDAP